MENCDLGNEDLYTNINNIDKIEFNRCKVFNMNILSKIEDLRKLEEKIDDLWIMIED